MPIYEYRCEACGAQREALQKISDEPLTECQVCGKPALKKLVSAAAFRLKGGGWYETDFKTGEKKKNLAGEDKAKAPKAEKSDAKPKASGDGKSKTAPASSNGSS